MADSVGGIMRILLIEDQIAVAELLRDALCRDGHDVSVALSGEEALDILPGYRPDAVFLDVLLPGMTGVEVLREIRARDTRLPVIVLSGCATDEEADALRGLGIQDLIQKPQTLTHLTEALARLHDPGSMSPPSVT
jgi:DNA-binding response OmpR family regulator